MRLWKLWCCLLAIAFIPVSASALPLIDIEGAVGVWYTSPSGSLAYDPLGPDDYLDVEDELNFDEDTKIFGRLKVDMPLIIPNIYLMANPMEFDESSSTDVAFKFGDDTFTENVPFKTELTLDQYDVGLYYSVPLLKTASLYFFNVEGGINVRIIDAEATITQPDTGLEVSESETIVVPMLYLGAQFRPTDSLALEAEARGVTYKDDKVYSLIGRLKVYPFGPWFVAGGYRYDNYDIDYEDFIIDVELSGPFVETGLSF